MPSRHTPLGVGPTSGARLRLHVLIQHSVISGRRQRHTHGRKVNAPSSIDIAEEAANQNRDHVD